MKTYFIITTFICLNIFSFGQSKSTFDLMFDGLNSTMAKNALYNLPESDKKEIEFIIFKNVADPIYKEGQRSISNKSVSTKSNIDIYINSGENQYITDIIDGEIIKLDDGSIWQVDESYCYISSIWTAIDDVVVKFNKNSKGEFCYLIKNEDDIVMAKLLKQ